MVFKGKAIVKLSSQVCRKKVINLKTIFITLVSKQLQFIDRPDMLQNKI